MAVVRTAVAAAHAAAVHQAARTSRLTPTPTPHAGMQKHALLLHPNDAHIIYPLGATVVIRNVHDNKDQTFLQGEHAPARAPETRSASRHVPMRCAQGRVRRAAAAPPPPHRRRTAAAAPRRLS